MTSAVDELPPRSPSTHSHHMPKNSTPTRDEVRYQRNRLSAAAVVRHLDYEPPVAFGAGDQSVPQGNSEQFHTPPRRIPRGAPEAAAPLASYHVDISGVRQHHSRSKRHSSSRATPYDAGDASLMSTINAAPSSLEAAASPSPKKHVRHASLSVVSRAQVPRYDGSRSMPSAVDVHSPEGSHLRRNRHPQTSREAPDRPRNVVEFVDSAEQPPPRTAASSLAPAVDESSSRRRPPTTEVEASHRSHHHHGQQRAVSHVAEADPRKPQELSRHHRQREPSPAEVVQRFLAATSLRDITPIKASRGVSEDDEDVRPPQRHNARHQATKASQEFSQLSSHVLHSRAEENMAAGVPTDPPVNNSNARVRRVDPPAPPLTLEADPGRVEQSSHIRPRQCG
jgi:hypothetical protein